MRHDVLYKESTSSSLVGLRLSLAGFNLIGLPAPPLPVSGYIMCSFEKLDVLVAMFTLNGQALPTGFC